jgi:hypothetical protein
MCDQTQLPQPIGIAAAQICVGAKNYNAYILHRSCCTVVVILLVVNHCCSLHGFQHLLLCSPLCSPPCSPHHAPPWSPLVHLFHGIEGLQGGTLRVTAWSLVGPWSLAKAFRAIMFKRSEHGVPPARAALSAPLHPQLCVGPRSHF